VGVIGTINYRFGNRIIEAPTTTPQSLEIQKLLAEMIKEGVSHVVMEVSSHAVDQRRIAGVHFDVGVFTNITSEHLDYHGTIEEYAKCKAMFFSHSLINSESQRPKYAVINQDDPYADYFASRTAARIIRYGLGRDVDITVVEEHVSYQGIAGRLKTPDGDIRFRSTLLGRFNLCNIMAAAGVAYALGIPLESVRAGIETCTSVPGRMERVGEEIDYTVIVDYAHTPDALEKVLHSIREFAPERIIAVFGCGGDRDRLKRPVMGEIAAMLADVVIVTSDNPRREGPEQIMEEIEAGIKRIDMPKMDGSLHETGTGYMMVVDREEAIRTALSLARKGDVVLVAGKGHEAYQTAGDRRIPFDDRLKVVKFLQERSLC
ncbi:MAG: UDP-N-acetylmuramoyl-L-alanyl-D-glutamate--2,6-diaminopimelate ligase, partial [Deltaproteobacteria bacterium]|nr:UDP-N-acetylmuramoyl-L-alanyl-D-glutamate--2,6-diaminopimelate ligase [Deltaproteobacteria bacterium]